MKRIPHMCITCKHFEKYHCLLNDGYIGYLDCAEPTKCRAWRLSDDYKKGGKFCEEVRKMAVMKDEQKLERVTWKHMMNDIDEMPPENCKECPHSDHEAWCLEPGPWKQRYYLPDDCINNDCPFGWGKEQ